MRSRDRPTIQTNFAKQMTFKLPTTLVNHLEQEIYEKLESAVELRAAEWNGDWAAREQRGEKYHFYMVTKWVRGEAKEVEKKINWHKHVGGLLNIEFFQTEPEHEFDTPYTDYYRPKNCTVNYKACKENAKLQAEKSIGLFESRVNGHLAVTDKIEIINLRLGEQNLIHGFVAGDTKNAEEFSIHTQMIWNYRYGANSANGYLTQYVQFRSDRRGAKQEGKTVLQRLTEQEKQAKADAKQAIVDQKNLVKWEKFQKLPVQMEKWIDKEIKTLAAVISDEGLAESQRKADRLGYKFDAEWQIKCITGDINKHNTLRNDLRHWQNDETGLKALFDKGVDTRNKIKEMYGV